MFCFSGCFPAFNLSRTHSVIQGRPHFERCRRDSSKFAGRHIAELVNGPSFGKQDLQQAATQPYPQGKHLQYRRRELWLRQVAAEVSVLKKSCSPSRDEKSFVMVGIFPPCLLFVPCERAKQTIRQIVWRRRDRQFLCDTLC